MSKVVVAAPPAAGHLRPLVQVAAHLVSIGHDVTLLTGPSFASLVESAGVRFQALPPDAMVDFRSEAWIEARRLTTPGVQQLNFDLAHGFGDPIPGQHAALQEILTEDDVLICDSPFVGGWPCLLGAPGVRPRLAIGVGISPIVARSVDTTIFGGPVSDDDQARAAARAAEDEFVAALKPGQDYIADQVKSCGAHQAVPFFMDGMISVWDVAAQLCVPEFEFPRRDAPTSLRFVGPTPAPTYDRVALPTWWPDLDDERPVVLVTQGTAANDDFAELVEPTLEALAEADVIVIAALGREAELGRPVPANARITPFIPFAQLLPRVSVMITNGGYGAVQQALRAAVPLVVAGAGEDKPATAARVEWSGVGRNLGTGTPSPDHIGEAVRAVLTDPSYGRAAQHMAEAIAGTDALGYIAGLVERLR